MFISTAQGTELYRILQPLFPYKPVEEVALKDGFP
jgi:hypothetical protein